MAYVSKIKVGSDTLLVGSNLYGECSTAADVAAKVVNISGFSQLSSGVTIHVKFDNTNKALSPTLNVSSTGAKPIYRQGKITPSVSISSSWADGAIVSLTYNTSNISTGCWVMNDVNIDPSEDVSYITNLTPYLLRPTCDGLIRGSGYNKETDEIVGGTVAWNQLIINGNFESTSGWNSNRGSIAVADNKCTFTSGDAPAASSGIYRNFTFLPHKYITSFYVTASRSTSVGVYFGGRSYGIKSVNAGVRTFCSTIGNSPATAGTFNIYVNMTTTLQEGDTVVIENVICSDLTHDFGSAIADYAYTLESATAGAGTAWLRKYGFFNKPYYAYNAGGLLSVMPTEHKMVGFNAWDEEWELGTYNTETGAKTSVTSQIRCKNLIRVIGGQTYHAYVGSASMWALFYDGNGNVLYRPLEGQGITRSNNAYQVGHATTPVAQFTVPSNCVYMSFYITQAYGTTYNNDICINISCERDGEYEPYKEWIYQIPGNTELRGLFKLDANNNLYVDGDIRTSSSTTRKYVLSNAENIPWGSVPDLSNKTLAANNTAMATATNAVIGDIIAEGYESVSRDNLFAGGKAICINNGGTIIIYDPAFENKTKEERIAIITGIKIVYKKPTPTIENTESYINPQITDPDGTEEYVDERDVPIPVGHNTTYDSISMIGPNVINKTLILQYS